MYREFFGGFVCEDRPGRKISGNNFPGNFLERLPRGYCPGVRLSWRKYLLGIFRRECSKGMSEGFELVLRMSLGYYPGKCPRGRTIRDSVMEKLTHKHIHTYIHTGRDRQTAFDRPTELKAEHSSLTEIKAGRTLSLHKSLIYRVSFNVTSYHIQQFFSFIIAPLPSSLLHCFTPG